jgi:hypothetical protein
MSKKILPWAPHPLWSEFERRQVAAEAPDYHRHLEQFEALYREAQLLGILPGTDPLAGIEVDIRIAAAVARPHVHRNS